MILSWRRSRKMSDLGEDKATDVSKVIKVVLRAGMEPVAKYIRCPVVEKSMSVVE